MTFYKKSSFNFPIKIIISVVFIIHIINISSINLSTSLPVAYGLTNEDRYNSGFVHGLKNHNQQQQEIDSCG
ncbi:MAG TPA: hypothetical protein VIY08_14725 [Candidatus Nitrosocosmicus sp.]